MQVKGILLPMVHENVVQNTGITNRPEKSMSLFEDLVAHLVKIKSTNLLTHYCLKVEIFTISLLKKKFN